MKRASRQRSAFCVLLLAVAWFTAGVNGCSEESDTGVDPGDTTPGLVIDDVILNPKSPGVGDTLVVTAVVAGDGDRDGIPDFRDACPNEAEDYIGEEDGCPEDAGNVKVGDDPSLSASYITYAWSASGGILLESNLSTVRWVAPDTSTVFTLTVTVSDGTTTKTSSREVFVNRITPLVASGAGEMTLSPSGDSLYYIATPTVPGQPGFNGFGVRRVANGVNTQLMAPGFTFQLNLNPRLSKVAYVVPSPTFGGLQVQYRNLVTSAVTTVPAAALIGRPPSYTEPEFSPDDSLLVYQAHFPDWTATPAQGGIDTFVVALWDPLTLTERRIAVGGLGVGAYGLNFHPAFSNDGRHLVYACDPTGASAWELYALPVSGRSVPIDTSTTPVRLTFSGGIMGEGRPPSIHPRAWNPNTALPILATLDVDNSLRLVPTDGSGDILVTVSGDVREFVWMASGQSLLLNTGTEIHRVTLSGVTTLLRTAESGDALSAISSSSDEQLLLYAVRRFNDVWYEVVDLGGTMGLAGPLRVTPSGPPGEATTYASLGSISPVWSPTEPKAYMLFFDTPTPRISTMRFGGLYP